MEPQCDILTFCTYVAYSVSGAAAIAGVLLTVFGSTGYFQTSELNRLFLYVGIALLLTAAVLIAIAFGKNSTLFRRFADELKFVLLKLLCIKSLP